ncbi:HlyD family secretion protein [Lysobacter sp. A286]
MARIDLRGGLLALTLTCLLASPLVGAVVLTGEVQAIGAQTIYVPQAYSSPVVLRYFVSEGERVKQGEVVLRIDMSTSAAQIIELDAQIVQAKARMANEIAELRVKAVDAELALVEAQAEQATAQIDAGIPAGLISGLDYDRYQGELVRTTRESALKDKELAAAGAAITRRQTDGNLEIDKLAIQRDFHTARVETAEVRAERDGVVVHGFDNWSGGRIDEGSSVRPGSKAGEVVSGGTMKVKAWALEPDRNGLKVGQTVTLAFDALPGDETGGRIVAIGGAPDTKLEWGDGRYFTIDIELSGQGGLKLLPGMSVRVDVPVSAAGIAP